jgi:uncharacterized protein (TIGR02118 family)
VPFLPFRPFVRFEKYYPGTHMPLVYDVKEIKRTELAVGIPGPDGKPPPSYRITELYFDSAEQLKQAAETTQWKKVVEDVPKFASVASPYSYRRSRSCPTTAQPAPGHVISALRPCGLLVALGRCLGEAEYAMCQRTKQKNVK